MEGYAIEHVGLAAGDPEALAAWYVRSLGFREFFRTEATPPVIFLTDPAGRWIEVFPRPAGEPVPAPADRSGSHLAVLVPDFEAAVAELEGRGVAWAGPPKDIFAGGKARFFADPEGNRLHIVWRPRSPW